MDSVIILVFLLFLRLTTPTTILENSEIVYDNSFELQYDPPNGYFSNTALAVHVFVVPDKENLKIYYEVDGNKPTLSSSFATFDKPYIQLTTPFGYGRLRNLTIVAVYESEFGIFRSAQHALHYYVEASARPSSYAFLVPGLESNGAFLGLGIEMNASARAQIVTAGGSVGTGTNEFADFFSYLGIGTYEGQTFPLNLSAIDPQLVGFEGGFAANTTDGRQYGFLIPYFDGKEFFGKVVRVDLLHMITNITTCSKSYYFETKINHRIVHYGTTNSSRHACISVLDLQSLHPRAVGFKRGFINYPYGYLSPGKYNIAVRIDVHHFTLNSTIAFDLGNISRTFGGYSGGFADGSWGCFNPFLTFEGPVGGVRSELPVDANHLRSYYHSTMICINDTAWISVRDNPHQSIPTDSFLSFTISDLDPELRGFSSAFRVGRYAYLAPFASLPHTYNAKVVRIRLGPNDIGEVIRAQQAAGSSIGDFITVLDLSQKDSRLYGYSDVFSVGQHLYLVPFRNKYEPATGQRGHGLLTRIDMNNFAMEGVSFVDLPSVKRAQIPDVEEKGFRGFSSGAASGKYALLFPFYNGVFSGKLARIDALSASLSDNVQSLDVTRDRLHANTYKGYRGGFTSLWRGVWE